MSETADAGRPWYDEIGLADDIEPYEVPYRKYAEVHPHADGTATLDEGWGAAYIETDTLYTLEGWR